MPVSWQSKCFFQIGFRCNGFESGYKGVLAGIGHGCHHHGDDLVVRITSHYRLSLATANLKGSVATNLSAKPVAVDLSTRDGCGAGARSGVMQLGGHTRPAKARMLRRWSTEYPSN